MYVCACVYKSWFNRIARLSICILHPPTAHTTNNRIRNNNRLRSNNRLSIESRISQVVTWSAVLRVTWTTRAWPRRTGRDRRNHIKFALIRLNDGGGDGGQVRRNAVAVRYCTT